MLQLVHLSMNPQEQQRKGIPTEDGDMGPTKGDNVGPSSQGQGSRPPITPQQPGGFS